jgi:OmcA/MtrC family decaheme c-type cytochrome
MLHDLGIAFCRDASHALRAVATVLILLTASTTAVGADDIIIVNYGPVTALTITISGASIGSTSTVDFKVVDQDGSGFVGLPVSALQVTLAQLQPGHDGNPAEWQSYINTTETPAAGVGIGTQPTVQSKTDSGGKLVDHGDGTYTYTFGTNITAVTTPIAVPFVPTLTHRVAIALSSDTLPEEHTNNATYTWQPSTGATTGILTRDVVDIASCNSCHSHLAEHGGPRQDTKLCVTCHNPGTTDAESTNTVNLEVMIHKIHRGSGLPSVQAGKRYIIYGRNESVNDFSTVVFPQDVRNCTKCHDPANPATPDAHLVFDQPTIKACGACHDDVNFATGAGHPGGAQADNSMCTVCHRAGGYAGAVADSHVIPGQVAAKAFQYNILSVTDTAPGSFPKIVFSVTNPQNNNQPYDLKMDPAFTTTDGSTTLRIDIGWNTSNINNDGTGSYPGQPISLNALTATRLGDGSYTITSTKPIPMTVAGSGTVAIEGHPAGDYNGDGHYTDRIPVTSAQAFFAITDPTPQPRRVVVDVKNCQNCHGHNDGLSLHGGNRTDNVNVCMICHNPNATDINRRPIDPDGTPNGVNTAAVDMLEQRPINFNTLIHSIHGADFRTTDFVVYGFGSSVNNFSDVGYPGILSNCTQCHTSGTYRVPLPNQLGLLGTTVDTHATVVSNGQGGSMVAPTAALTNSSLYSRITPTAAACSGCHDDVYGKAHMEQMGASFYIIQGLINTSSDNFESCPVCHAPGKLADIDVVHNVPQQ